MKPEEYCQKWRGVKKDIKGGGGGGWGGGGGERYRECLYKSNQTFYTLHIALCSFKEAELQIFILIADIPPKNTCVNFQLVIIFL